MARASIFYFMMFPLPVFGKIDTYNSFTMFKVSFKLFEF